MGRVNDLQIDQLRIEAGGGWHLAVGGEEPGRGGGRSGVVVGGGLVNCQRVEVAQLAQVGSHVLEAFALVFQHVVVADVDHDFRRRVLFHHCQNIDCLH